MALLLQNWKLVIIGVLMLAIAGMGVRVKMLNSSLAQCEAEKIALSVALDASQSSVKGLQAAIEDQNNAVQKFKNAAEEREKNSRTALAKARATSEANRQKANDLLKRTIPQNTTACDAANQLINEVITNGK